LATPTELSNDSTNEDVGPFFFAFDVCHITDSDDVKCLDDVKFIACWIRLNVMIFLDWGVDVVSLVYFDISARFLQGFLVISEAELHRR